VGDAGEMLVAAEMTLAGVPAMTVPDNWPGYDVIAQPREGGTPQRISVKVRTFTRSGTNYVIYKPKSVFDWLAIVTLSSSGKMGPKRKHKIGFCQCKDSRDFPGV
jgi:hypothetical protein